MNVVAETLSKCLNGKELNNMIDDIRTRQDRIGQKKMVMQQNSEKDRHLVSMRFLNQKQPFYQMPNKIPED